MKKLLAVLLTVALAVTSIITLSGCTKDGEKSQYIETKTKDITVGITNAAPMNYEVDGQWVGFDTELTVTVFNALGYNVMFKEIEWANKYTELEAGTIDCLWNGFTANGSDLNKAGEKVSRGELVNLSINYMTNYQCIVKNKNVEYVDENSLAGKTVAFEKGSSGDAGLGYIIEDFEISVNKKEMTSQVKALIDLNAGTADFAIVDRSIAENLLSTYTNIEITDSEYFELEYYAVAFNKNDSGLALKAKVDTLLKAFYDIGYLKELCEKYSIEYSRVQDAFEA